MVIASVFLLRRDWKGPADGYDPGIPESNVQGDVGTGADQSAGQTRDALRGRCDRSAGAGAEALRSKNGQLSHHAIQWAS